MMIKQILTLMNLSFIYNGIFSWDTFIKLLKSEQYDSAMHVLPFCFMIQAVCSPSLNRDKRLKIFEISVNYF